MNQHLGATYTISVLIVVSFAVLMAGSAPSTTKKLAARGTQFTPKVETKVASVLKREPSQSRPKPVESLQTTALRSPVVIPRPVARTISHIVISAKPHSLEPFTRVVAGETLTDVCRRIYGTTESVPQLWRANRDQLASVTSPLRDGMLLRTP